jgi:hypothetical protein
MLRCNDVAEDGATDHRAVLTDEKLRKQFLVPPFENRARTALVSREQ